MMWGDTPKVIFFLLFSLFSCCFFARFYRCGGNVAVLLRFLNLPELEHFKFMMRCCSCYPGILARCIYFNICIDEAYSATSKWLTRIQHLILLLLWLLLVNVQEVHCECECGDNEASALRISIGVLKLNARAAEQPYIVYMQKSEG